MTSAETWSFTSLIRIAAVDTARMLMKSKIKELKRLDCAN